LSVLNLVSDFVKCNHPIAPDNWPTTRALECDNWPATNCLCNNCAGQLPDNSTIGMWQLTSNHLPMQQLRPTIDRQLDNGAWSAADSALRSAVRFSSCCCRPMGAPPSRQPKTADFFFLSYVYNQFLCSLTCTNTQFFSRTLEYLAVFNIHITIDYGRSRWIASG
jgi:hypothetical protein